MQKPKLFQKIRQVQSMRAWFNDMEYNFHGGLCHDKNKASWLYVVVTSQYEYNLIDIDS